MGLSDEAVGGKLGKGTCGKRSVKVCVKRDDGALWHTWMTVRLKSQVY